MAKRLAEDMQAAMRVAAHAYLTGATRQQMAEQAGVDPTTITRWRKTKEWAAMLDEVVPGVNNLMLRLARGAVINALSELKDPTTARFVLERLDRSSFAAPDKSATVQTSDSGGAPITIKIDL